MRKNKHDLIKIMITTTLPKSKRDVDYETLRTKAAILDELLELIEDKYLVHLMRSAEKENRIPLSRAKKLLR